MGSPRAWVAGLVLAWVLWPRKKKPGIEGAFPVAAEFRSELPDVVLDRGLAPSFGSAERLLGLARVFQNPKLRMLGDAGDNAHPKRLTAF